MADTEPSLYKRLGGYDVIAAFMTDYVNRLRADPRFARFGAPTFTTEVPPFCVPQNFQYPSQPIRPICRSDLTAVAVMQAAPKSLRRVANRRAVSAGRFGSSLIEAGTLR